MLFTVVVDPYRRQHQVLAEVHATDEQCGEGKFAELAAHQLSQFALGPVYKPPPAAVPKCWGSASAAIATCAAC